MKALAELLPDTPSTASTDSQRDTPASALLMASQYLAVFVSFLGFTQLSASVPSRITPLYGSIPSGLYHQRSHLAVCILAAVVPRIAALWESRLDRIPLRSLDDRLKLSSCFLSIGSLLLKPLGRVVGSWAGPEYGPVMLAVIPTLIPAFLSSLLVGSLLELNWPNNIHRTYLPLAALLSVVLCQAASYLVIEYSNYPLLVTSRLNHLIYAYALAIGTAAFTMGDKTGLNPAGNTPLTVLNFQTWTLLILGWFALQGKTRLPYTVKGGDYQILAMNHSITGMIMVAENVKDGFRFLRCDHSLLGGRWVREGKTGDELGDSIFSAFVLQEAVRLAERTLHSSDATEDALIIGLGAGISAHALMRHGIQTHVIEIDPAVYKAAQQYFDMPDPASHWIMDGNAFVIEQAAAHRFPSLATPSLPKLDFVVHDCFTGGFVPPELFTIEFWSDLAMLVKTDGIVAINFAGVLTGKAFQAVLHTLHEAFAQCRTFRDALGAAKDQEGSDLSNLVIFCTMAHSPLLTFRPVREEDKLRSPLRHAVLSSFLVHEVLLDRYFDSSTSQSASIILHRGSASHLNDWQVSSALATYKAMRDILPFSLWAVY